MKIALGTVQFGINYGVNNISGIPSNNEISSILNLAKSKNIDVLDTALAYGNSENIIGDLFSGDFKIVSKFSNVTSTSDFNFQLQSTLNNLKRNSIYGYLAHNPIDLIKNVELWDDLVKSKTEGKIEKIGFSLYSTDQLCTLLDLNLIPDIVQLPYSLLDRKFEPYLSSLKSMGIEIHTRSTFLQGLYFIDIARLPNRFHKIRSELSIIHDICIQNNCSIGELALNFVNLNQNVDKIIIGVEKLSQLETNLKYLNDSLISSHVLNEILAVNVKYPELLNPSNW